MMTVTASLIANNSQTTVVSGVLNNSLRTLSFSVASTTGALFPTPTPTYHVVTWDAGTYTNPSDDPNMRIGLCTARSADVLTVEWGQFGTPVVPVAGAPKIAFLFEAGEYADVQKTVSMEGLVRVTVGQKNADFLTDGVNDQVQIQNAINIVAAGGGGTVVIRKGIYSIASSLKPKSYVRVTGEGMFSTKLVATSALTTTGVISDTSFTPANPLVRFSLLNLEIDGTSMPRAGYQIGQKGVDSHNLQQCTFQNLYIHDTPASGLGVDNLDRVLIDHCYIKNCGTAGQSQGSNGIGLGTGGNNNESFIVTNCITENSANAGYLAEDLESVVSAQKMYIFANNISLNDFDGIRISGCDNVTVTNNSIYNPTNTGIRLIDFVTHYAENTTITGNLIDGADSYGIYIDTNARDFLVETNTVKNGTIEGVLIRGARGVVRGNNVHDNGKHGIFFGGGGGGSSMTSKLVAYNIVYNNSKVTANCDGIRLDGANVAITDFNITGNRCFDNQGTKTQRYGIILSGGTGHGNLIVVNNNLNGNLTGAFLKSSFTLSSSVGGLSLANNIGLNPDMTFAVTFSSTPAFNRSNGRVQTLTLTGNITPTLPVTANTLQAGERMTLVLTQDGTGSRTVTWPANFKKAGGTLTLSTGANAVDTIEMMYDGTNWYETNRALNAS